MNSLNFFDKFFIKLFLRVFDFYQRIILKNAKDPSETINSKINRELVKIIHNEHPWFGKEDIYIMLTLMVSPVIAILLIIFLLW